MPNSRKIVEQYQTVLKRGGIYPRDDRGVIEVTGKDRGGWLNNLVTNVVKNLSPGEGNYAFATDVRGRTVFDLGILVREDRLWLDVDRRWIDKAMRHLTKYVITEDVQLRDLSEEVLRFALIGSTIGQFLAENSGVGNFVAMAQWQHASDSIHLTEVKAPAGKTKSYAPVEYIIVRNDFCGSPAADGYLIGNDREVVGRTMERSAESAGLVRIEREALEILRIEAGIPGSVDDIDEDVVPPETGRIEQGISYHKGCYLGQEVIERMRSHGVLARRLVGLKFESDALAPRKSPIKSAEKDIGRITSICWSEALAAPLALGYVKTAFVQPGTSVSVAADGIQIAAQIVALPVRP